MKREKKKKKNPGPRVENNSAPEGQKQAPAPSKPLHEYLPVEARNGFKAYKLRTRGGRSNE